MDDLLREFLTETNESLDTVDNQLVRFEQDPNNAKILDNIFRLVHTIKGTCGFLGLPRLEALAHAAETLMGKFRDGMPVTGEAVTLILSTIDRIKEILGGLEATEAEPEGTDEDLIERTASRWSKARRMPNRCRVRASDRAGSACRWPRVQGHAGRSDAGARAASRRSLARRARARLPAKPPSKRRASAAAPRLPPAGRRLRLPRSPPRRRPQAAEARAKTTAAEADQPEADKIANQSIRVNVDTLEHLMTMVSELVLTRNQLLEICRRNEDTEFKVPLQRLSNVTAELQEGVMKTRMQPIGNAWQKLPRIVRDLSGELGKQIELEMHGADTELDRQVLDLIKDPLTHMVRNSADHGLETPAERAAAGKPRAGHHPSVRLSRGRPHHHLHRRQRPRSQHRADQGQGDLERSRHRGRTREDDRKPRSTSSSSRRASRPPPPSPAVSGRGVGMDVVRTNIDQIGGTIDIKSVAGEGSSVTIKIPLTLAIVSALIVEAGGDRFAIPQLSVVELVRARANSEHRIERIKDTAGAAPAQQAAAADASEEAAARSTTARRPIRRTASSW